jgi:hypothetical protein
VRRQVEDFMFVFPSNLAPIVGQQVTLGKANGPQAGPRIDLLIERAEAGECDLVVKTEVSKAETGFLYSGGGQFQRDRSGLPPISDPDLRAWAASGAELTYTCVPPGSGGRIGIDRDEDGVLDGDES